MIIDVDKLPKLTPVDITIMSEHWVLNEFLTEFYFVVVLAIPLLMYSAYNKTPLEYNENDYVTKVSQSTCCSCLTRHVPTLFFLIRGIHNLEDFYKDIHYAMYQPHSNISLKVMLYISIFFPVIIVVYLLYKIGIASEHSPFKRFFYVTSVYFGGYFGKISQT